MTVQLGHFERGRLRRVRGVAGQRARSPHLGYRRRPGRLGDVAGGDRGVVVDNLNLIARFTAQPTPGDAALITVHTIDPDRRFTIELTATDARFMPSQNAAAAGELELPAEAFVRLIYGRLDPHRTPPFTGDAAVLDRLRATYPGP